MVKLCNSLFGENEKYKNYFNQFPFELSDFQKYAIQAIVEKQHILITAHTGSGKTLPAEFAIDYFKKMGKKVIYTSPIKALSNQKFHEFSKKFPDTSFGILTGDIKFNPEADVLIMTTEILRNTLLQKKTQQASIPLHFEMDFQNELGCVIFDEIHYINDADRGKVWEETIMFLPSHIQLIMLSATIDKEMEFASWIENVKKDENNDKIVYLAPTNHRVVPLKHYLYATLPQGPIKNIKDKEFLKFINQFLHKPIMIKDNIKNYYDDNHLKMKKLIEYTKKNNSFIKPSFVLNEICKYLQKNNMLPAICFVFSRKNVEKYAQSLQLNLLETDEEDCKPIDIEQECIKILKKIPNYQEYILLPEFEFLLKLLKKGIAVHHSGIMPVFREMIELVFEKGYIKMLFATETFAVGINMPTKTVLFTSFEKYNGSHMRMLLPHEYTQMAGRAGRRGLDTVGHVIHLNNLFDLPYGHDYKNLLNGKPQLLQSKFQISYNLILNFLLYENDTITFAEKSLCFKEITKEINQVKCENELLEKTNDNIDKKITEKKNLYEEYYKLKEDLKNSKQKKRKQIENMISTIENENKNLKNELKLYDEFISSNETIEKNKKYIDEMQTYFTKNNENYLSFLQNNLFIENTNQVSIKGIVATNIQETHCLAITDLLEETNYFKELNPNEIAALLSCFSNIRVQDEYKIYSCNKLTQIQSLDNCLEKMKDIYTSYDIKEGEHMLPYSESLNFIYELVNLILEWCNCKNEIECKQIIRKCEDTYQIFTGEFIKSILKLNNLVNELKNVAEFTNNVEFLYKLNKIPELTLKFIATNQSLYV